MIYGTPEGTCAIFLLTRGHDLLSRSHDLVSRGNELLCRSHDLVSRGNDLISRGHELIKILHMSLPGFRKIVIISLYFIPK